MHSRFTALSFRACLIAAACLLFPGSIWAQGDPAGGMDGPGLPPTNYSDSPPLPGAVILPGLSGEKAGPVYVPSPLPADYDWWNGCVPTAAGMLFGYWEEHGYDAFPGNHRNLPATYPGTSTNPALYTDARGVIAGWAHKQSGMAEGWDYGNWEGHAPDSLADFMETEDGGTSRRNNIMTHGMKTFAAWDDPRTPEIESRKFTTQNVWTSLEGGSWDYADYCAEINAGRPVHLGLDSDDGGHGVLGVGYYNQGGTEDVVLLTTWHSGLQQWEWENETHSGHNFSVYGARLATPDPTPCPELSAYFSVAHTYIGKLDVEIGIGNPNAPLWHTNPTWSGPGSQSSNNNLVLTDIDCTGAMSLFQSGPQQWYLKVYNSSLLLYTGTIEDFQIRYEFDEVVFDWSSTPVPVDTRSTAYVYLDTYPVPYIPGDANHDNVVDQLDAEALAAGWGEGNATWEMGDFDKDGTVGPADAAILAANWDYGTSEAATVPEPGAMAGLLIGAAGLLASGRRRRR